MTRAFLRALRLYILLGGTLSLLLLIVAALLGPAVLISGLDPEFFIATLLAGIATGFVPLRRYFEAVRMRDCGMRRKAVVTGFEYAQIKFGAFGRREPLLVRPTGTFAQLGETARKCRNREEGQLLPPLRNEGKDRPRMGASLRVPRVVFTVQPTAELHTFACVGNAPVPRVGRALPGAGRTGQARS